MNRPQFFIVGAQRSGTTYLYSILDQHPEISMARPVKPEPKYFLQKDPAEVDLNKYFAKYYRYTDETVLGEKSTSYYESANAAKLIHQFFPDAKILFSLRDPVQRALSNYYFSVDNGLEKRTLEEVFIEKRQIESESFTTSVNPFDYIKRGEYINYLETYLSIFPREQVYVLILEEFRYNQNAFEHLFRYLGVDETFEPAGMQKMINTSSRLGNRVGDNVARTLQDHYKGYNDKLSKLLNKELAYWK